jgi:SAM-dependent methyltransferase
VPSKATILKTCLFYAGLAASVFAVVMAFRGALLWAAVGAVFALGADVAGRVWSRRSPVPMPYFMRWILLLPRGPHSPKNLERVLQPRSGERILEIGPGVGVHALPVASLLLPNGVLDVLDVQQDMLDNLARRAARSGLTNIVSKQGDAQKLPYPDQSFDAAYLIGVLGEIPDPIVAMCELKRVLKPSGRLVISEILIDPDFISRPALQEKASDSGFVLEWSAGPAFAYSAVLRPAASKQFVAAGSPPSLLDARCSAELRSKERTDDEA